jgi:hypothetical protein
MLSHLPLRHHGQRRISDRIEAWADKMALSRHIIEARKNTITNKKIKGSFTGLFFKIANYKDFYPPMPLSNCIFRVNVPRGTF